MTQSDRIRNLVDYFSQVRKRPVMFLGENTITKLYDHLHGYRLAYQFNDVDNPADKNFFDNFVVFVHDYYDVTTSHNWKGLILEQCFGNEQNALATFFELFDMFTEKVKPSHTKRIVLLLFDKIVFEQAKLKEQLGDNFLSVLDKVIRLMKDSLITQLKYDYDSVWHELEEMAKQIPELEVLLIELSEHWTIH